MGDADKRVPAAPHQMLRRELHAVRNATTDDGDLLAHAADEVHDLHGFFQTWYRGEGCESTASALTRLHAALHPSLTLIDPDGVLLDRAGMLALIVPYRGCYPDLRIIIRNCDVREVNRLLIATYIEEQFERGKRDRRRCTAVLMPGACEAGLTWLAIHETRMIPA